MLITKVKQKLSSQFLRNMGWLGTAEIIVRVLRLGITIVVARFLTPKDYGLVAIVMTAWEFTRVFVDVGIGLKIIRTDQQDLNDLCDSVYWLNWLICSGLFILQCLLAFPISWFYHNSQVILPICVLSLRYLMIPVTSIQTSLLYRENRFKIPAVVHTIESLISYALTIGFAILGMGYWSVILPLVLAPSAGILIYYTNHSWRPGTKLKTKYWRETFDFGKNILGIQLLKTLRNNLDYLIVGHFLGVEVLGLYFFSFNAGLGISLSISNTIGASILPYLCAAQSNLIEFKKRYFSSLKIISLIIIPLVFLQSSLAYWYVPVIAGQKWVPAIPILILICLSAIPRPFADAASQLLVVVNKPDLDLRWNLLFTGLFTIAIFIGIQWQAIGVAMSVLLIHMIALPLFTFYATRYVFSKP